MKFVLLHEGKNDDGIRAFFTEVWELYVKVSWLCWLGDTD
jgi:trafficking protein particle complex subunit 2